MTPMNSNNAPQKTTGDKTDLFGMQTSEEETNVDINVSLRSKSEVPSAMWSKVNTKDIGEGFEIVDPSVFEVKKEYKEFVLNKFKNKFVIGKSKFISYDAGVSLKSPKKSVKTKTSVSVSPPLTKDDRKRFVTKLSKNIKAWREFFVHDILPVSLSIHTALEETKDQLSQLVDSSVTLPSDYIVFKTAEAVYLRINREIGSRLLLNQEEQDKLSNIMQFSTIARDRTPVTKNSTTSNSTKTTPPSTIAEGYTNPSKPEA